MTVEAALDVAIVVVGVALVACLVTMVVARIVRAVGARRRARATAVLRPLLVAVAAGEPPPEVPLGRYERGVLVDLAVEYLGKVRGEGSEALQVLLAERGGLASVRHDLTSRSAVHRARAAMVLGAAGDESSRRGIEVLLADPDFEVRATAVRSLGQLGDPRSVPALLDHAGATDRPLAFGTVVMALVTIGSASVDALVAAMDGGRTAERQMAAEALGLLGAVGAVDALAAAADHDPDLEVRIRSIRALGRLGSPRSVPTLVRALGDDVIGVRAVAARALGAVGDASAPVVEGLASVATSTDVVVAVNAAQALGRLGAPGRRALEALVAAPADAVPAVADVDGPMARHDQAAAEALALLALADERGGAD